MTNLEKLASDFFDAYEANFNEGLLSGNVNIEAVTSSFAEFFVESSPVGVICGKNDENFAKKIPDGYAFYTKIGMEAMHITNKEITELDNLHVMVKVSWNSVYKKDDGNGGSIPFYVFYFLRLQKERLKIFSYITGDEQQALKNHGLI